MALLVGDVFRRAATTAPGRPAASLGPGVVTFGELDRAANRLARVLRARGVTHRDRVVWWGDTCLEAIPLFTALAKLGAVFAPVNARLAAPEAAPFVAKARPALVVVDTARAPHAGQVTSAVVEAPVATAILDELVASASEEDARDVDEPALDERDAHVIFFTSGSTGEPKGVVLSHRADVLRSFPGNGVPAGRGGTVCMFPMFHMAAWSIALGCWQACEECTFVAAADPDSLLGAAASRRSRRIYLIPSVWARVLGADRSRHDLSALREADTGTSATPPELLAAIRAALPHTETRVLYGSTEAGPGTVLGTDDLSRKPGSVGRPSPGVELRIGDGREIHVRSPFLMDGYFEDPEATAAALVDGWYRTGDVGVLDDERYLAVVGRVRDVIRTGGETVAPPEVEAVLAAHLAVAEVAVVGLPDPAWGEVVCAVIVVADGAAAPTVDDLRRHCDGRLAAFKHPRRVEVVDALPRTAATGQVQRTLVVERLVSGDVRRHE